MENRLPMQATSRSANVRYEGGLDFSAISNADFSNLRGLADPPSSPAAVRQTGAPEKIEFAPADLKKLEQTIAAEKAAYSLRERQAPADAIEFRSADYRKSTELERCAIQAEPKRVAESIYGQPSRGIELVLQDGPTARTARSESRDEQRTADNLASFKASGGVIRVAEREPAPANRCPAEQHYGVSSVSRAHLQGLPRERSTENKPLRTEPARPLPSLTSRFEAAAQKLNAPALEGVSRQNLADRFTQAAKAIEAPKVEREATRSLERSFSPK